MSKIDQKAERYLLSDDDWKAIIKSLEHTKLKFEDYPYPTVEYKQSRIAEVNRLILKIKTLLDS